MLRKTYSATQCIYSNEKLSLIFPLSTHIAKQAFPNTSFQNIQQRGKTFIHMHLFSDSMDRPILSKTFIPTHLIPKTTFQNIYTQSLIPWHFFPKHLFSEHLFLDNSLGNICAYSQTFTLKHLFSI